MLIGFKVGNFLSFNEETVFSMVATKGSRHNDHVMYKDNDKFPRLVKGSFFYGANASGKSNFVEALKFVKDFITNQPERGKLIERKHFLLCAECEKKPSTFEFEFITKGKIYNYRFEITNERVVSEILKDKTNSEKILFKRDETGIHLSMEDTAIMANAETVRENNLILSEFINRDINMFYEAYNWFYTYLIVYTADNNIETSEAIFKNKNILNELNEILTIFDTGILEIFEEIEEMQDRRFVDFFHSIPKEKNAVNANVFFNKYSRVAHDYKSNKTHKFELKAKHRMSDSDNDTSFMINMESDGTKKIIDFIPMLFDMANNEKTYIFDEIGRSLHPHLLYRFIETYYEFTKGKNCQLIATTHQDNLIDLDLLRQDEIWFVEKDNFGQSSIYPLSKYKLRNDKDVRTSYNSGRLGAIPSLDYYFEVDDDDE